MGEFQHSAENIATSLASQVGKENQVSCQDIEEALRTELGKAKVKVNPHELLKASNEVIGIITAKGITVV